MFRYKAFRFWFFTALLVWCGLFFSYSSISFLQQHWYYPAIMVVGAFVAGVTPEGGGAVAFPVLNIFLQIDRVSARDFSLMIQSIGMTSASIFILSRYSSQLVRYRPLLWCIPLAFTGFIAGMLLLQHLPVPIIQALFLSLITSFAVIYCFSDHRGSRDQLQLNEGKDKLLLAGLLIIGGACASLFGTGADIILYTALVTRFRMQEKYATHISIMLMAALSVLGFAYRYLVDDGLSHYQVQTWLCAYPVVLFMAPLGALVLHHIHKEVMVIAVAVLNVAQLSYFLLVNPSPTKLLWAAIFTVSLSLMFLWLMRQLGQEQQANQS